MIYYYNADSIQMPYEIITKQNVMTKYIFLTLNE